MQVHGLAAQIGIGRFTEKVVPRGKSLVPSVLWVVESGHGFVRPVLKRKR